MTCRHALGEITPLSCYKSGCRSTRCRAENTRWSARRRRQLASGRWAGWVDAGPVRDHINALSATGMTLRTLAEVAQVEHSHMVKIRAGHVGRCQKGTADRIMAAARELSPRSIVPATGTLRRVQALMVIGWAQKRLAVEAGVSPKFLLNLMQGKPEIEWALAQRIAVAYDRLWNCPPTAATPVDKRVASSAVRQAAARGYAPPLAWDDDEIDNPKAKPRTGGTKSSKVIVDEVAVERLKRGQRVPVNKVEQRTAIAELAAARVPTAEIADRLGMGLSSAIRTRNRITAAERQSA